MINNFRPLCFIYFFNYNAASLSIRSCILQIIFVVIVVVVTSRASHDKLWSRYEGGMKKNK